MHKYISSLLLILSFCAQSHINAMGATFSWVSKQAAQAAGIAGLAVGGAIGYGIANDMVSARVCPEYFSEGFHRKNSYYFGHNFPTNLFPYRWYRDQASPTALALSWGTVASISTGAMLAKLLVLACRLGPNQLGVQDLAKPLGCALAATGITSLLAGIYGYYQAKHDKVDKDEFREIGQGTPESALNRYIADAYAHQAAYTAGAVSGLAVTGWCVLRRLGVI